MAWYKCGGGGGADVSFVTATADKILNPYIGSNQDGEPITGTLYTQEKTATANGEITPDSGNLLSKVTVSIPTFTW